MKSTKTKKSEAKNRLEAYKKTSSIGQIVKLNEKNYRAVKERTKLAKIIGCTLEDTYKMSTAGEALVMGVK